MADEERVTRPEAEEASEPEPQETPEPEETPVAEEPAAEGEDVAEAAEEPSGEVPADEAEEVAEEVVEEAPAAEPARKPKRKRLPRAQRHKHVKPKRERPAEHATRPRVTRLPKPEHPRGRRQECRGVAVSSAMDKTIVVEVDTVKAHPKYKKVVRRSAKFHAHDEQNAAKVGDRVRIVETRPISKKKNWHLV